MTSDDRAIAQARNILGITSRDRRHLAEALRLAERLGDAPATVAALNNLALADLREGEAARALPLATRALAESEALGDRHREAALHNNLADVLRALGRDEEAMRHLKRGGDALLRDRRRPRARGVEAGGVVSGPVLEDRGQGR